MRKFIYFIAGLGGMPSRETVIAASGLGYAFPVGMPFATRGMNGGLGSGVLAVCGDGTDVGYYPERQVWVPIREGVMLGLEKDPARRPGPLDLIRGERCVDGHPVVLGDGHSWTIPVVRFAGGDTRLPRVLVLKPDGSTELQVRSEYRDIVYMADRIIEVEVRNDPNAYTPDDLMAFAAGVLEINYRLGRHEISALQLIDTENVQALASAALDGPTLSELMEALKKKGLEISQPGPDSEIGAAGSLATAPR